MKRPLGYGIVGLAAMTPVAAYFLLVPSTGSPISRASQLATPLPVATTTFVAHASSTLSVTSAPLYPYLETIDGCGPYYGGTCVSLRSGPGTQYPTVMPLRNDMVLKVASSTVVDGQTWYEIGFDGDVHYPERVTGAWYVSGAYVRPFLDPGPLESNAGLNATSTKRIVIDLKTEMLYAYEGDTLFMKQPISTGLKDTPTPEGTFWVYRKLPDSYMQGPVPGVSDQYYDLPGVPWDLYFTKEGGAIHGAYWHTHFGEPWSHGCVNLPPDQAHKLYEWTPLGTPVIVKQ